MTYSLDFRRQVLSVQEKEGLTFARTAARFSVGVASLTRWAKSPEPKATREGRPRKVDLEKLARDVRDHPDTLMSFFKYFPTRSVTPGRLS
ncbi:IS630 transposase-related protein [Paracoccus sp. (in: a-proteobacteria)]|uniref:IS630 transposase-related protein n=1 Tax=Paracoccus sp. TaxID=267 RepID=UPI003A83D42F